ncbi:Radical SAM domain protein [Methanohalobium evestigatum Z-7303]|uniref:Radical SAM domain protein n=1 Tax=Methanohalobium evestigatum (strain ATCC BAA-1072 / DSM 3721 / NBRC 107634 / OCM 161 / Z-7303) TaxID=644295 RepID=D7E9A4_METEZ|nr:radical SAM protein [Methanohalobium evestigatum]ADI74052.1 Radical SAM domain protein [Methanohalobium evestigatum Z-7303]
MGLKIVYGPVPSKRLGRSLGIDVIRTDNKKNCNFDCVYCQLGHTDFKVSYPENVEGLVTTQEAINALVKHKNRIIDVDYITFSGTCEPTLNLEIGNMIKQIKNITHVPVCVITNSSLMERKDVRQNLLNSDLVIATLVTGFEETFKAINRPYPGIKLENIINGLEKFSKQKNQNKKTELAIEIMLIESKESFPMNTTECEIDKLIEVTKRINPDRIELLTVNRPPAENHIIPVSDEKLKQISDKFTSVFGSEKVELTFANSKKKVSKYTHKNLNDDIYSLISRRPCTFEQICDSLGAENDKVKSSLEKLIKDNKLITIDSGNYIYYKTKSATN